MSTDAAVRFAKLLATDQDFQDEAAQAVAGREGAQATDALIQFGSSQGLEITSEELLTVRQSMMSVELSDESLDSVAGGLTLSDSSTSIQGSLQASGDDAQLSNFELQQALQEQTQMIQMSSNITKSLHDAATAIINNLR